MARLQPDNKDKSTEANGAPRPTRLPTHWRRGRQMAALGIFIITLLVTYKAREFSRADQLDAWWLQARFSTREMLDTPKPDPDIVLVEMDNKSLSQWPEPNIAWGAHLAAAIDRMRLGGARLVALDWVQPEETSQWFNAKFSRGDELLATSLSKLPAAVMVKLTRTGKGLTNEWIRPTEVILYSLPNAGAEPDINLGYAEFSGQDNVVAAFAPAQLDQNKMEVSFAGRIAEKYLGAQSQVKQQSWIVPNKVAVPLRDDGTFLINYANNTGIANAFEHYSLADIAQPAKQPDTRFRDKIVIIGATFSGSNEQHYVPLLNGLTKSRFVYGPEIQANIVRTLLNGRPIREPGPNGLWLLSIAVSMVGLLAFYFLRWGSAATISVLASIVWLCASFALFVTSDYALPIMLPLLSLFMTSSMMGGYRALREERERGEVLKLWGRYQNPRQVEYLLQHPEARGGEGQEMEVTVLFADLKSFTKTVEHLSPTETLQVLNRYLALFNEVVEKYEGTVDKYLGDGLMAQWGAPEPLSEMLLNQNHTTAAVQACLEIEERARVLTESIVGNKDVAFGLRLTLHTGSVVVGWVGAGKLEYTIIGDTVNVTSRLQETAKQLDCEFLISESTYQHVDGRILTGQEAEVEIRGRQRPLRVFEVLGLQEVSDTAEINKSDSYSNWQKECETVAESVNGSHQPAQTEEVVRG